MNEEQKRDEEQLPYGGTAFDLRAMIARQAAQSEEWFASPAEAGEYANLLAHRAALYGWATVALLGWIGSEVGEEALQRAAAMVQDMGENGGAPYCDGLTATPPEGTQP